MFPFPSYVEKNYNGFAILKFFSKKDFMKDFLMVNCFLILGIFFMLCEKEGVGDYEEHQSILVRPTPECLVSMNIEIINDEPLIVPRDYTDNPKDYKPTTILQYSSAENRYKKAICFYSLFLDSINNKIKPIDKKMEKEFGKYAVLIHDKSAFYTILYKALKEDVNIVDFKLGFVDYKKDEEKKGFVVWDPFKKDQAKYGHQNELRVSIQTKDKTPFVLDLKQSLNGIVFQVEIDSLLSDAYMKEGLLYYKIVPTEEGE